MLFSKRIKEEQHEGRVDNGGDAAYAVIPRQCSDETVETGDAPYIYNEIDELIQISRMTRIHFWFVTSLPIPDALPRELLNNIATRVAFHTTTKLFSKQIIDKEGAENLASSGQMIFKQYNEYCACESIHCDEDEIGRIIRDSTIKFQNYNVPMGISQPIIGWKPECYDEYFEEAARLVIEKDKATIGYIQRVFHISFNRSAIIMDQLEDAGVVGPENGTHPRKVLMTMDQFEEFMSI
ncbi:MAG: hypothetical protein IKQ49_12175 [Eubacterium sp.]|nr:hypothetical protein [Eubacterium sp.]